jgi:hypothetical protein
LWPTAVIPALGRQRQEDPESEASPDYIMRPYLETNLSSIYLSISKERERERKIEKD